MRGLLPRLSLLGEGVAWKDLCKIHVGAHHLRARASPPLCSRLCACALRQIWRCPLQHLAELAPPLPAVSPAHPRFERPRTLWPPESTLSSFLGHNLPVLAFRRRIVTIVTRVAFS